MANLDPRTIDLIRTLIASKLDWLAFELMDELRAGDVVLETDSDLEKVREDILTQNTLIAPADALLDARLVQAQGSIARPIAGDDQIDWAADFIVKRLEAAIHEWRKTLENFAAVLVSGDGAPSSGVGSANVSVSLGGGRIGIAETMSGEAAMPEVRKQLDSWIATVRGRTPQ